MLNSKSQKKDASSDAPEQVRASRSAQQIKDTGFLLAAVALSGLALFAWIKMVF